MLTNAYGELEEFLAGYGRSISNLYWASFGEYSVDLGGLLLRLEGTFYYKNEHVGCLNPEMILAGNGYYITRTSDECWKFHSYWLAEPLSRTEDYHIWTGGVDWSSKKEKGQKIYVAGPYTADIQQDIERNVRTAIDIGIALLKKGHFPFIPHLSHYVDIRALNTGSPLTWEEYMMQDLAWLEVADALFFMGESKGADIELEAARVRGLNIYYKLSEVPDVYSKSYEIEEVKR
jgi:hypothetical protein